MAVRELAGATYRLVVEAQRGMARAFDVSRVRVLQVVSEEGPVRPGVIGERLDLAPSSVTRHVQALEDAGHVVVRADPSDARTCLVELTSSGLDELRGLAEVGGAAFAAVVEEWKVDELRTMARLVRRLTEDWAERGGRARRRAVPRREPRWRFRSVPGAETTAGGSSGGGSSGVVADGTGD
jgi:DNA-binding MarR family transcriptional regulator